MSGSPPKARNTGARMSPTARTISQMSRGTIQQYQMYGLMPIGDTPRTSLNWWQHTDIETKKRWFGEPWGGPDTELARPFYVANQEKKMAEAARVATDPQAKVSDFIGTDKTREQQVPIIDALVNNNGAFFQVNVPEQGRHCRASRTMWWWKYRHGLTRAACSPCVWTRCRRRSCSPTSCPACSRWSANCSPLRPGDRTILLYNVLMGSQTHSFDQAAAVLDDLMTMEGHEELAAHYAGREDRWRSRSDRGKLHQNAGKSGVAD